MNSKKKRVQKFIRWCKRDSDALKEVKTHVLWNEAALATPDGVGFGVTTFLNNHVWGVWVAAKWPTKTVMTVIAHEYAHCIQHFRGRDLNEEDAEITAERVVMAYQQIVKEKKKCK